ncbi:expressed unknown protein [Ectocarpus siliculosus]|uniref:Uncharacterized protein n=1 Tax=Ectocarpus siliculosus TaxID=2880 RepID=D8LJS9_ECTSI|nr:expressed unknown protein [Ectocarpus siliculosus]|eukprot:CBN75999.1 expressed unknown protein [Ectocarpus siliculosus]
MPLFGAALGSTWMRMRVCVMGDGRVLQLENTWTKPACQGCMEIWRQLPPRRGPHNLQVAACEQSM